MSEISELYARDPMKLSDQDITSLIEDYRKKRKRYALGDKSAGSTKPPTATQKKQSAALAITGEINIADL